MPHTMLFKSGNLKIQRLAINTFAMNSLQCIRKNSTYQNSFMNIDPVMKNFKGTSQLEKELN